MRRIDLTEKDCLPDSMVDSLGGKLQTTTKGMAKNIVKEPCEVYKPNGELLLKYVSMEHDHEYKAKEEIAVSALRGAAKDSRNRGMAAGKVAGKAMHKPIRKGGRISATNESLKVVDSGVAGYMDKYVRFPYCRQTAYNLKYPGRFKQATPWIEDVSVAMCANVHDRWEAQMNKAIQTNPDFKINGTAFTTITINKNFQTAFHKDAGDLKEGIGVMTCHRTGTYAGGILVFPKYQIGVDMRNHHILFADVHEWHGNTPLVGVPGKFERLSFVLYYRENMIKCKSAKEELEIAKRRQKGDKLYGD